MPAPSEKLGLPKSPRGPHLPSSLVWFSYWGEGHGAGGREGGLWGHLRVSPSPPQPGAHRLGVDTEGALEVPRQVPAVGHSSQPQPEPELGTDVPRALRRGGGIWRGHGGGDVEEVQEGVEVTQDVEETWRGHGGHKRHVEGMWRGHRGDM